MVHIRETLKVDASMFVVLLTIQKFNDHHLGRFEDTVKSGNVIPAEDNIRDYLNKE